MDIYKQGIIAKVRFNSQKGQVSMEDLYDLPLTSARGVSLDALAKDVNRELKNSEEESFVTTASKASSALQLKLDILKDVIAFKKEENESKKSAVVNKAKKERIKEILAKKQDDGLESMSEEDLKKMYESL